MDEKPMAWLYTRGEWKEINDPVQQGHRVEEWYEPDERWGYPPVMLMEGREGAPYPYALDVPQYMQIVYAFDFPSYVQLLERLAPMVLAESLSNFTHERHQRWGRKGWKKVEKRQSQLRKAKIKAGIVPPTG